MGRAEEGSDFGDGLVSGLRLFLHLGQSEIEQLDAGARDQNVAGLEVAMHDAFAMRGVERVGDLHGVLQRARERQRTGELGALDVLHHQVVGADIVERADIGVIERCHGAGFTLEAVAEFGGGDFDGDGAVEARIAGLVDLAHAARSEQIQNLVGAHARAGLHFGDLAGAERLGAAARFVLAEQGIDFAAQLEVRAAGFRKKHCALVTGMLQGGVVQQRDLPPTFRSHAICSGRAGAPTPPKRPPPSPAIGPSTARSG